MIYLMHLYHMYREIHLLTLSWVNVNVYIYIYILLIFLPDDGSVWAETC